MATVTLKTSKGEEFIIDAEDAERVSTRRWYLDNHGYLTGRYKGYHIRLHRFVLKLGNFSKKIVDHKDRNKLNNTKANLRFATKAQNNANKTKRRGTSQYKGVNWYQSTKRWVAQIGHEGKVYNLGYYKTEEAAAEAYNKKAVELFGDFASPNLFLPFLECDL